MKGGEPRTDWRFVLPILSAVIALNGTLLFAQNGSEAESGGRSPKANS